MEIIYAVDAKMSNDGEEFERTLAMDISSMNVLACSSYYLATSNKLKYSPHLVSASSPQTAKSQFCVYVCALEQPWHFCLIATSHVPIVHLVWSSDGTILLICNQMGTCRAFKMKNGCINSMENFYQYETNEDILSAKFIQYRPMVIVGLETKEFSFYGKTNDESGYFICCTTSGVIHTLPLNRSLPTNRYSLAKQDLVNASLCDILPTEIGFNVVFGERTQGSLIHFFLVDQKSYENKSTYISGRGRGFRIPSCYGTLESLIYFQRNGTESILTRMSSPSGDLIDLYEYNFEQKEWISITLLSCSDLRITSISLSPSTLCVRDNDFHAHFGRQILITVSDGSMLIYDKFSLKCKEQLYPLNRADLFKSTTNNRSEYFVRIQHTASGACCLGITESGVICVLRTVTLEQASTVSMQQTLVQLLEQWIAQDPAPFDVWDVLCLINNENFDCVTINPIVDQLVHQFESQAIEIKRTCFSRFKQCIYQLHRLACPFTMESCEHLTSLLIYHSLLIVRDYLRLFVYEPNNRNGVEIAEDILQQTLNLQNLDLKRMKYPTDQGSVGESSSVDPRQYQLISFISLVNWISDLIFYLIGYLQLQQLPAWLPCKNLFNDYRQVQWLRELMIYFYILHKTNKIASSKMAHLQPIPATVSDGNQQATVTTKDIFKDIYQSITKLGQRLEAQKNEHLDESLLDELTAFDVELLQSKADGMFPKSYPFLVPNSRQIQSFIRGQAPPFAAHLYGNPTTADSNNVTGPSSSFSSALLTDDYLQDSKFDVITMNKMSLSSNPTFRRCLRCSNFSRIFKTKPYPFLVYRLKHRCLCGGLFLLYTRSNSLASTVNPSNGNGTVIEITNGSVAR